MHGSSLSTERNLCLSDQLSCRLLPEAAAEGPHGFGPRSVDADRPGDDTGPGMRRARVGSDAGPRSSLPVGGPAMGTESSKLPPALKCGGFPAQPERVVQ